MSDLQIIKISPKGQVTIPKKYRALCESGNFALEVIGKTFVLRPVEIKVIEDEEMKNFGMLSEKSLEFLNDPAEDVYQEFYDDNYEI